MILLTFIAAFLFLSVLVSGFYAFSVACVRKKELDWLKKESVEDSPYSEFYDSIVAADKWLHDHHAEDLYIRSADGLMLHGLWVPADFANGTMILVHGYRSNQLADFGFVLDHYHKEGYNLLLPEQRCHGKSEGRYITFGVKESDDVLRWIDYHNIAFGEYSIVLCGLSMGASTVMYLADEPLPRNVKGIIADCGFTSPKDIISCVYKTVTHIPPGPSIWVTDILARLFAGFHLSQKDTRITLTKNRLPILFIHGLADEYVPYEMSKQSFSACSGHKELLLVEGAGHAVSFLVDKDRYTAAVDKILNMTL